MEHGKIRVEIEDYPGAKMTYEEKQLFNYLKINDKQNFLSVKNNKINVEF